jgi:gliding motility-associated-like protein
LLVAEVNDDNDADTNDDGLIDINDDIDFFGEPEFSIQDPIEFNLLDSGNFLAFVWDFGDGSQVQNSVSVNYRYTETGTYKIVLTALHNSGCTFTREKWIKVSKEQLAYPNAFTPNGDYKNDTIKPFQKSFKQFQYLIYNSWGQLVYSEKLEQGVNENGFLGWDGTLNGKPAQSGKYVMIMRGVTMYGKEIVRNVTITLIR